MSDGAGKSYTDQLHDMFSFASEAKGRRFESCQAYHRINDLPRFSVQPIPRVTKWITEFPNGSRSVPVLEAQRAKRHGLHPQNPPSLDSTPPLLPHGRAHRGGARNTEPSC